MTLNKTNKHLLLNVGFILKENAGYSRDFAFDEDEPLIAYDVIITGLHGNLHLSRTPQGILVQGILEAQTPTDCTRCLTPFDLHFTVEFSELFVYPRNADDESPDDESPYYVDEYSSIDLTPILREEGIIAIPIQALCRPDCKGICAQCGQALNEAQCDCVQESFDPRLAELRALLDES